MLSPALCFARWREDMGRPAHTAVISLVIVIKLGDPCIGSVRVVVALAPPRTGRTENLYEYAIYIRIVMTALLSQQ